MNLRTALVCLAPLASLAVVACTSDSEPGSNGSEQSEEVRSSLARDENPVVSEADKATFTTDQATFAVDLYQAVRKDAANASRDIFLSPHSASTALAMTYAGARGTTAAEMKSALRFGLADTNLHKAFNWLDLTLSRRGERDPEPDQGNPFRLHVANSVWNQKGMPIEAPFLDILATDYGAGVHTVDFVNDTENARLAINGWVEDRTEDRIKNLLPAGAVSDLTKMVLVNAVYFNASWASPFEPEATTDGAFTKLDGSTVTAKMMHGQASRRYVKGDGFEAVELPYRGNELSLLVIAPDSGNFAGFESALTGKVVLDVLAGLQSKEVNLSFPKLKLESAFSLLPPLRELGMKTAFTNADFSGITTAADLHISDVLHKTFLSIDEKGTEAAAATAVVMNDTAAPVDPPVQLNIDRPFITAIVDRPTNTLVFLGRILEPKN